MYGSNGGRGVDIGTFLRPQGHHQKTRAQQKVLRQSDIIIQGKMQELKAGPRNVYNDQRQPSKLNLRSSSLNQNSYNPKIKGNLRQSTIDSYTSK